jgi:hypothetical protein
MFSLHACDDQSAQYQKLENGKDTVDAGLKIGRRASGRCD